MTVASKPRILIVGAGGFAREVASWLPSGYMLMGFFSESALPGQTMDGVPVYKSLEYESSFLFTMGVGDPKTKEKLWNKMISWGLKPAPPIMHKSAIVGKNSYIEPGSILCPNSVVTCDCSIGKAFILNLGSTVGHDCRIGSFVTVSPGANISGNCTIGSHTYIGTNSSIREKIRMGDRSVLGGGAFLTKHVPNDEIWAGVPAIRIK